jgi:hypothetical protein
MLRPSKRFIRSREPRAIAAKRRRLAEAEPQTQQIEEPMAPGPDEEQEEQEEDEDEEGAGVAENEYLQHYQDLLSPQTGQCGVYKGRVSGSSRIELLESGKLQPSY